MKPIRIQFVQDRRWRWVWSIGLVVAFGLLAVSSVRIWVVGNHIGVLNDQLARVVPLPARALPAKATPVDVQATTQIDRLGSLLQLDLNRIFAVVENIKEAAARLREMSFDSSSGTVRLEFELDSVARASAITQALNAGLDVQTWKLERLSTAESENRDRKPSTSSVAIGIWSAATAAL